MREISIAESLLCARLRPILASARCHAPIPDSDELRDALGGLEWFLPEVLKEIHPQWKNESLDGIFPGRAVKVGDDEIDVIGACILITDQTLTPLRVRLQLDPAHGVVSWLECWLGESRGGKMRRVPYSSRTTWVNPLGVVERFDSIKWFYHAAYGERRP
jgi:hypothetical protein